jgi:hypothetical protein
MSKVFRDRTRVCRFVARARSEFGLFDCPLYECRIFSCHRDFNSAIGAHAQMVPKQSSRDLRAALARPRPHLKAVKPPGASAAMFVTDEVFGGSIETSALGLFQEEVKGRLDTVNSGLMFCGFDIEGVDLGLCCTSIGR